MNCIGSDNAEEARGQRLTLVCQRRETARHGTRGIWLGKLLPFFGFCFEAFGSRHASPLEQWSWKLRWYGALSLHIVRMSTGGQEVRWRGPRGTELELKSREAGLRARLLRDAVCPRVEAAAAPRLRVAVARGVPPPEAQGVLPR